MTFHIETERLILRDVQEEDIPILLAQSAEPESRKNILSRQLDETYNKQVLANAMAWAKVPQRAYYKLSVVVKTNQTLIGTCSITGVIPEAVKTCIGWHYGHQYRGNGYATEAARELLYIGFGLNKVSEIYADCFAGNPASIRVIEKIGMRPSWNFGLFNILRGWSYGEHIPTVRHTISRNQWLVKTNRIRK